MIGNSKHSYSVLVPQVGAGGGRSVGAPRGGGSICCGGRVSTGGGRRWGSQCARLADSYVFALFALPLLCEDVLAPHMWSRGGERGRAAAEAATAGRLLQHGRQARCRPQHGDSRPGPTVRRRGHARRQAGTWGRRHSSAKGRVGLSRPLLDNHSEAGSRSVPGLMAMPSQVGMVNPGGCQSPAGWRSSKLPKAQYTAGGLASITFCILQLPLPLVLSLHYELLMS